MWMLLGFFGVLAAGAAADTLLTTRSAGDTDDTDDSDVTQADAQVDPAEHRVSAFFSDQPAVDLLALDILAEFDFAPDVIHSSDAFAIPPSPQPIVANGGDTPSQLNGGALDDVLTGGSAETYMAGHGGDDILHAAAGPTHQIGGEGNDVLIGGAGDDRLEGGEGDDLLIAGGGSNTLLGGAGNDILVGATFDTVQSAGSGPNFLNGGDGDDILIAGQGDYLNGGAGADAFGLGDWLQNGAAVTLVDYHPDEDQILLHYDPERVSSPDLEIRFQDDTSGTAQIWLNGQIIAQVLQAPNLTIADIGLVPMAGPGLGGLLK
jgi:Ca2+-binding RTX toxin-like protein